MLVVLVQPNINIITAILQIRKLRHKYLKQPAQVKCLECDQIRDQIHSIYFFINHFNQGFE